MFYFKKKSPKKRDRETEKKIAQEGNVKQRLTLAGSDATSKEILYYLAEKDPDPRVRKAVAANPATPVQVSSVLAVDADEDVRLALAARLIVLLPELSSDRHSQLYAFAVQALATLALDEVLKIRRALSSALKDQAMAPPNVVNTLARDIEREISEPVLRFCAALADDDLIDILKNHPESWAVQAIAGREKVSAFVSQAVIDTGDVPAGAILLENKGAAITMELLGDIVKKAKATPEWQDAIAKRKNLPPEMARELADFAEASVRDLLLKRGDFDAETIEEISAAFHRRMDFETERESKSDETPVGRAARLKKEGRLNEETIADALGMRDGEFVIAALAACAGIKFADARMIADMKAAKPLIALSYKAGLPMRLCLRLQKELCHIPPAELVYPRGGTDYPLSEEDINWQWEFLGFTGK